jgi:hypothetical protein
MRRPGRSIPLHHGSYLSDRLITSGLGSEQKRDYLVALESARGAGAWIVDVLSSDWRGTGLRCAHSTHRHGRTDRNVGARRRHLALNESVRLGRDRRSGCIHFQKKVRRLKTPVCDHGGHADDVRDGHPWGRAGRLRACRQKASGHGYSGQADQSLHQHLLRRPGHATGSRPDQSVWGACAWGGNP